MYWIYVAYDMDQAVVNTVMNFGFHKKQVSGPA